MGPTILVYEAVAARVLLSLLACLAQSLLKANQRLTIDLLLLLHLEFQRLELGWTFEKVVAF